MSDFTYDQVAVTGLSSESVWSVSLLNLAIRQVLRETFGTVWLEGEVSNFTRAASGHLYFSLRDAESQIRAVMWRGEAAHVPFDLHDGLDVVVQGMVDVYAERGQHQVTVHRIQPKGIGSLELAFRQLLNKLRHDGLFELERKRPLPPAPCRIAVITSPRGAALRDFLQVGIRRWGSIDVTVIPAAVQGEQSVPDLLKAFSTVEKLSVDVVALIRGGGSTEDLWSFNSELLARAIARCRRPVITGIGHEVDVTIADYVADVRALTPTEAAERLFPVRFEMIDRVELLQRQLASGAVRTLQQKQQFIDELAESPGFQKPLELIESRKLLISTLTQRHWDGMTRRITGESTKMATIGAALDALSPLKVFRRGYAQLSHRQSGQVVTAVSEVHEGDHLIARLGDGAIVCEVKERVHHES